MLDIESRSDIQKLCKSIGVKKLYLFGSEVRDDFHLESDVDVLVQFDRDMGELSNRYFDLQEGLEAIWGRPVDVIVKDAIKKTYFRTEVESSKRSIYEEIQ